MLAISRGCGSPREQSGGDGAGAGAAIEEGVDVGARAALAAAGAELGGFELAGLDPVPDRRLMRAADAGDVDNGQELLGLMVVCVGCHGARSDWLSARLSVKVRLPIDVGHGVRSMGRFGVGSGSTVCDPGGSAEPVDLRVGNGAILVQAGTRLGGKNYAPGVADPRGLRGFASCGGRRAGVIWPDMHARVCFADPLEDTRKTCTLKGGCTIAGTRMAIVAEGGRTSEDVWLNVHTRTTTHSDISDRRGAWQQLGAGGTHHG